MREAVVLKRLTQEVEAGGQTEKTASTPTITLTIGQGHE